MKHRLPVIERFAGIGDALCLAAAEKMPMVRQAHHEVEQPHPEEPRSGVSRDGVEILPVKY